MLLLESRPTFSKWPKLAGVHVHSTKSPQKSDRKSECLNIEKELLVQRMM